MKSKIRELKKIASDGFASIQNRLSEIENENLAEILSKAINIFENQKNYSEDFLLKLESAIKSQNKNILSTIRKSGIIRKITN